MLDHVCDAISGASPPREQSAGYRMGHTAGIRRARICVLDQIAVSALHLSASSHASDRERARVIATLRTIATRLSEELRTHPDDEVTAGYRAGIAFALELVADQERTVRQQARPRVHVSDESEVPS